MEEYRVGDGVLFYLVRVFGDDFRVRFTGNVLVK